MTDDIPEGLRRDKNNVAPFMRRNLTEQTMLDVAAEIFNPEANPPASPPSWVPPWSSTFQPPDA
jgi:hypothetical protein